MNYQTYIGLEVHIELKTKSKMFCNCSALYFGKTPNSQCCPVCLGLPGALPVCNKEAIERLLMVGLALNCKINKQSFFDRKNYFYPDLPKGYQISQHYQPFCFGGLLRIKDKNIRIREVHLEEDTGKLLHSGDFTLIDFNRSGVPLMEIVSEPDMETVKEVKEYLKKIQQIVRYLGVSDCDMEKGSMRCEPSVSIKIKMQNAKCKTTNQNSKNIKTQKHEELPDYRVEIKNINSFRFVQKAVEYEIERQKKILEDGGRVIQETRGWSEEKNATVSQRVKEVAKDYRYFPEPDIPPLRFSDEDIEKLKGKLPELPEKKRERFTEAYDLSEYDTLILTGDKTIADYYEELILQISKYTNKNLVFDKNLDPSNQRIKQINKQISNKQIANLLINKKVDIKKTTPQKLAQMLISGLGKQTMSEEELKKIIDKVLKENQKAVNDYKKGKVAALMFLIGCVMRETKGQAEAEKVKELLNQLINKK